MGTALYSQPHGYTPAPRMIRRLRSAQRKRVAGRVGTLCLCALAACAAGHGWAQSAQAAPPLTVLVADFTDSRTHEADKLSLLARDAVAGQLGAQGQSQFRLAPRAEVLAAAKTLGMRLPRDSARPAELTSADWFRLARAVHADAVVTGEITAQNDKRKGDAVLISVLARDSGDGEPLNGAQARQTMPAAREGEMDAEAQSRGVADAALDLVRQMLARPVVVGTVLNARPAVITLNRGSRDGLRVGDELRTYRYGRDGLAQPTGRVRVTHTREDTSEAKPLVNNGIGVEDVVRKAYRPNK